MITKFEKDIIRYITDNFSSSTLTTEQRRKITNGVSANNQGGEFAENSKIQEFEQYVKNNIFNFVNSEYSDTLSPNELTILAENSLDHPRNSKPEEADILKHYINKKLYTLNNLLCRRANEMLVTRLTSEMRKLKSYPKINSSNTILIHCHGSDKDGQLFLLPSNNRLITYQPMGYPAYSSHLKNLIFHSKEINPLLYLEDITHTKFKHFKGYTRPHIWEPNKEGKKVFNFDYKLDFALNRSGIMRQFGFYTCKDDKRQMKTSHEIMDNIKSWNSKNDKIYFKIGDLLIHKSNYGICKLIDNFRYRG